MRAPNGPPPMLTKWRNCGRLCGPRISKLVTCVKLFKIGVAIIEDRLGLELHRRPVLNNGYNNIIELGNNIDPVRVSPEDIEKVKRYLGTDQEPMWFLDMIEYRWKQF
jgi:hypothetical protein